MLFTYLMHYRDDTRTRAPQEDMQQAPFRDYVMALLRGQPVSDSAVHQLFRDPTQLEEEFLTFDFK